MIIDWDVSENRNNRNDNSAETSRGKQVEDGALSPREDGRPTSE